MKLRSLVPMAEVASVPRSIEFYGRLGFAVRDTFTPEGEAEPTWASLHHGGAELMLARVEAGKIAAEPRVLFYLYCDDVAAARAELVAQGLRCGEIATPFYAPRGEFELRDPNLHLLVVTHT